MSEEVGRMAAAERRYYPPTRAGRLARWRARTRERRAAHWNRPPHPRDWRWVVGGIGRILIVLGLLMFGFVAYQLWGTAIQTAQAQSDLKSEFNKRLEAAQTSTADVSPSTAVTVSTTPLTTTATTSPSATTTATTTATTVPAESSSGPVVITERPLVGDAIALIDAPAMSVGGWAVIEGVGLNQLKDGVGHFPDTPLPGELGNAVLAGHRTSHGAPFFHIDRMQAGDTITVQTLTGRFVYQVTSTEVVSPSEGEKVIPTLDPTKATLTLVSCHPAYTTRDRFVVHSELIIEQSAAAATPPPVTAPPSTDIASVPLDTEVASVSIPEAGSPAVSSPASPATTTPAISEASSDAFSQGWFGDATAWPHVAAWGLLLAGLATGGWWLCRRFRRYWVGVAAAMVPFVVALYFWYENVNRLLPPGF